MTTTNHTYTTYRPHLLKDTLYRLDLEDHTILAVCDILGRPEQLIVSERRATPRATPDRRSVARSVVSNGGGRA